MLAEPYVAAVAVENGRGAGLAWVRSADLGARVQPVDIAVARRGRTCTTNRNLIRTFRMSTLNLEKL